jgi:hypothetical protein
MKRNRWLLVLPALVLAGPAMAQHHKASGGRPAAGGGHPGQVHPGQHHQMSPEQQMEYEFYQQQMMLNEMMRPRGRTQAHVRPGRVQNQTGANFANQASGEVRQKAKSHAGSGAFNSVNPAGGGAAGTNAQQSSAKSGTKSKSNPAAKPNEEKEREREERKEREREESKKRELERAKSRENRTTTTTRQVRFNDNLAISLLKNVHHKLRDADADYQGHRIRAMDHVANAIRELGSTSGINIGSMLATNGVEGLGAGQLSQSQSDRILKDAIWQLNTTQGKLATGTAAPAHHRSAHVSIAEAVRELKVALEIR